MAALPPTLAINSLLSDFKINPRGDLFTVSVDPLCFAGKCVLVGDAGHAILPFYGQGLNAGFEDVRLLFERLDRKEEAGFARALTDYSECRLPDARAIDHLARLNYHEMRYQVRRRLFRFKCRFFLALESTCLFKTRYTMIAFTSLPYSRILFRERVQLLVLAVIFLIVAGCSLLVLL